MITGHRRIRFCDIATDLRDGRPLIVYDEPLQTFDLAFAAAGASVDLVAFAVCFGSGLIEVALPDGRCDELRLVSMPGVGRSSARVAVDASSGIGTGISAADRARTINVLADTRTVPDDLRRPGHVKTRAVTESPCHCEPSDGLVRVLLQVIREVGIPPAVARTALLARDTGEPFDRAVADRFARQWGLRVLSSGALPPGLVPPALEPSYLHSTAV
jgi:3,4-dihydroxy 2-butanone 4-phosphate synthase/GTP cyclohydrolase II